MTRSMRLITTAAAAVLWPGFALAQPFPADLDLSIFTGAAAGDNFGKSVAIGDFNGDGILDYAIGAPYSDLGAPNAGAVFIYFGTPTGTSTTPDLILTGMTADDHFGISIAGGFDLNGDGIDDLAIGARFCDLGGANAGSVCIYYGGNPIASAPALRLLGEAADDWFGQSVAGAGDVNGDGFADLIVGAPYNDQIGTAAGKAYIFFGGDPMSTQPGVHLVGAAVNHAHFGWSVSGAGDVNGDGFADVIVGARLHGTGPFQGRGRAYIFHGGAAPDGVADLILEGEFAHDWFGESVGGGGDFNGDGFDDVVVGAIYADPNGSASGKGYVYFGGNPMNAVPDLTFGGPEADAQLGNAVALVASINDDSFADVLLGAHFANAAAGNNAGKAFVLQGGQSPNQQPAYVIAGQAANDQLGASATGVRRMTPGPHPFIVGAHYNNAGGIGAGRAYAFALPGSAPPCPADWNGDGVVNSADIAAFITSWLGSVTGGTLEADFNGDGMVNSADIAAFITAWLSAVAGCC